jgi:hypothetical protein
MALQLKRERSQAITAIAPDNHVVVVITEKMPWKVGPEKCLDQAKMAVSVRSSN